jgi:hypothetical protein
VGVVMGLLLLLLLMMMMMTTTTSTMHAYDNSEDE